VICIFCQIAQKTKPAEIIIESDLCMAFLDHEPFANGHTLIIPKKHISDLPEMPASIASDMMALAQHRAQALRDTPLEEGSICAGTTLYMADGIGAQPHVPHLHLHVIPRQAGDALRWQQWLAELPIDAATEKK
jgi:histidine triad (HIT) family protein